MASRTITGSEKGIRLRTVESFGHLLDVCKVRNYSKGNKLFLRVSGLAEAITAASIGQGSAKENAALCGFVYGGLVRSHERESSEAMPLLKDDARFADCRTRYLKSCGAHTISVIFVKFVRLRILDMAKTFPFLKDFRNGTPADGGYDLMDLELINQVTDSPGVYIIEAADKFRFPYPKGNSSILYIGMSDSSLRGRLKRHRLHLKELCDTNGQHGMADNEEWVCQRYQYMYYHGAKVYYYSRKGKQEAKNLEAEILWQFYAKYRALPVGNGAKSYSKPK